MAKGITRDPDHVRNASDLNDILSTILGPTGNSINPPLYAQTLTVALAQYRQSVLEEVIETLDAWQRRERNGPRSAITVVTDMLADTQTRGVV